MRWTDAQVRRVRQVSLGLAGAVGLLVAAAVAVPACQVATARVAVTGATYTMVEQAWARGAWPERAWVPLDRMGHVPQAILSAEDQRFWTHEGFDTEAIRKAMDHNRKHPSRRRGASTISQQVSRNLFLWQGGGWARKGLEAWYTVWLELIVPKERILELYCNIAETGPGVFGVEAGARHHFGKPAASLTRAEAARLAAVLPSPRRWRPDDAHVRKRAAWILANPAPSQDAADGAPAKR